MRLKHMGWLSCINSNFSLDVSTVGEGKDGEGEGRGDSIFFWLQIQSAQCTSLSPHKFKLLMGNIEKNFWLKIWSPPHNTQLPKFLKWKLQMKNFLDCDLITPPNWNFSWRTYNIFQYIHKAPLPSRYELRLVSEKLEQWHSKLTLWFICANNNPLDEK